jgi:hypothetical protein
MINFICIENTGYGADEFTKGSGGKFVPSRDEMYANTTAPMCWAGFFKPQWVEICEKYKLTFYNFDSAYFGNGKTKTVFRLTINGFQNINKIIERSADRWEKLNLSLESFSQGGDIVIVPPDRKICHTLNLGSVDEWIEQTILEIKKYSDRNIRIRTRPEPRSERTTTNTFKDFIKNNTFCVIGYSSNALVEAAMCDVPVIPLGHSATKSLYEYQIKDIENIKPADNDKKLAWLYHLSYCQFSREELLSGHAWKIINN